MVDDVSRGGIVDKVAATLVGTLVVHIKTLIYKTFTRSTLNVGEYGATRILYQIHA